jgi:hypothetical protein
MSLEPDVVDRIVTGAPIDDSQVLLNYARVSRGPWRLKALIDRDGHAVTNRFITVRRRDKAMPDQFLWALLNSPLANAFAFAHFLMKRDNLVGTMRKLPIPVHWETGVDSVVRAVNAYFAAADGRPDTLSPLPDPDRLRHILLQVDAEVLQLYDLPPRVERELLDIFVGWQRQGVPFKFDRYYPPDFEPCFPLHEYLSDSFQQSTAGALRERRRGAISPEISAVMRAAVTVRRTGT